MLDNDIVTNDVGRLLGCAAREDLSSARRARPHQQLAQVGGPCGAGGVGTLRLFAVRSTKARWSRRVPESGIDEKLPLQAAPAVDRSDDVDLQIGCILRRLLGCRPSLSPFEGRNVGVALHAVAGPAR